MTTDAPSRPCVRLAHFRWRAYDCSNAEGRDRERYRLAAWSLAVHVLSQVLGMVTMILGFWLVLPYLGAERFGLWMTVVGFAGLLSFLDFGIGNALINRVSVAATGDAAELRDAVTGGLTLLAVLAIVLAPWLWQAVQWLPWQDLLAIDSADVAVELRQTAACMIVLFLFGLVASGAQKTLLGLQLGYLVHGASALGYLVAIPLLVWLADRQATTIWLLLSSFGLQVFAGLGLLIVLRNRRLLGRPSAVLAGSEWLRLRAQSRPFFVLQLGAAAGGAVDSLIVANAAGGSAVAQLALLQRLFQFVAVPLQLANSALWGGYADAHARGDRGYLRRTLAISVGGTALIASVGCLLLVLASPWLIERWSGGVVAVAWLLCASFAAWIVVESIGGALGVFMNATGILRPQLIAVVLTLPLTLAAKYYGMASGGLVAVFALTTAIFLVTLLVLYAGVFRRHFVHVLREHA